MGRVTTRVPVVRVTGYDGALTQVRRPDTLAVEEPLEIRAGGRVITVTMRTPGSDLDLAHGFLLAEGVIKSESDIVGARYCAGAVAEGPDGVEQNTYNVLEVDLANPDATVLASVARLTLTSSACGVCGSSSIEAIADRVPPEVASSQIRISVAAIKDMLADLRTGQQIFASTGGVHAAGIFLASGQRVSLAEDVGRHNAVDKVVGAALRAGTLPRGEGILVVSSRASFEIVQKAAVAGLPIVVAVSAPSSLAVETASTLGMTLVGFARERGVNVYTRPERIEI